MNLPSDLKHFSAPRTFDFLDPGLAFDIFWIAIIIVAIIL